MPLPSICWGCLGEWAAWPHAPSSSQEHQRIHGLEYDEPRISPCFQGRMGRVLSLEPSWAEVREGWEQINK